MSNNIRHLALIVLICIISACANSPSKPAPVVERTTKPSTVIRLDKSKIKMPNNNANQPASQTNNDVAITKTPDWRPDSHTVKKGDTLYSIGLEYGYDYKEIAALNNIDAPYSIKIGQILKLKSAKDDAAGDVVITPIKTEAIVTTTTANNKPKSPTIITEPKAKREPYSVSAMNKPAASTVKSTDTKAAEPKSPEIKPAETKPTDAKSTEAKPSEKPLDNKPSLPVDSPDWAWPTKGKVVSNFNQDSNKGIDIAGEVGQSITAAAAGKVIYSGSDLRGYGKLVIIKHNNTFLSVYAHNSKISVKEGQQVVSGQKIAEMGNSDSEKIALHFEIRQQGKSVDPLKFLAQK